MAKMGYEKGKGLGKNSDGVTTALSVQPRNHPSSRIQVAIDSDPSDESKYIKSQQVWDILGGETTKRKEPGRFGHPSKVIVAWGCIDGIDWAADKDRNDGGIVQKTGEEFDVKVLADIVGI